MVVMFMRRVQKHILQWKSHFGWICTETCLQGWNWRYTPLVQMMPTLQWRHNEHDGVSNPQSRGYLLNRLFRHRSKKTSKLRVTGLCVGNSPVTSEFPAQKTSNAENFSIEWHHHVTGSYLNQWWFSLLTLICINQPQWVDTALFARVLFWEMLEETSMAWSAQTADKITRFNLRLTIPKHQGTDFKKRAWQFTMVSIWIIKKALPITRYIWRRFYHYQILRLWWIIASCFEVFCYASIS